MAHAFESVVFYRCSHCGNVVAKVIDQGVPLVCCGEPMKALKPGTEKGVYFRNLGPEQAPEADFAIGNEKPLAVYEYCNLHGLWVTEL